MTRLVDIVNFNADASCFDSRKWLASLTGGRDSQFCGWLSLYTRHCQRLVLGLTGATISDLWRHNPEALAIIKEHPDIFQIILRPYTHDIPLLRTSAGFSFNLKAGHSVLQAIFGSTSGYYLPPEFMMTNEQIYILDKMGIKATFVNAQRHQEDLLGRIPPKPYLVKGVLGSKLGCIPVKGHLTEVYLHTIQQLEEKTWNQAIHETKETIYLWRDGESSFLLPDGIDREEFWLTRCQAERLHLGGEEYQEISAPGLQQSYPMHSFAAWMKELRMLGFLRRVEEIEKNLPQLTKLAQYLWLLTINSDILSAVEKSTICIHLRFPDKNKPGQQYKIFRTERNFEGEDYLALLYHCLADDGGYDKFINSTAAHLMKAKGRIEHLQSLEPIDICNNVTHYL